MRFHKGERGILAEDITFEYWKQLMETSYALEEVIEASGEFILVYDSTGRAAYPPYSLTKGDVFITNGTSSAGILGHAGIAISSDEILHIAGPEQHPDTITLSGWNAAKHVQMDLLGEFVYRMTCRHLFII